ncbi:hypothetical protein M9H77_17465 [Catharanthus roseus]|uniref:Uncharacterized protein n=1 Tax=Catharanthus roseus TaxID=4058 RepID=A0ACC0B4W8_CATRO|nr:hypothetical protein M9H77_17465 [Catharanthus roseus]
MELCRAAQNILHPVMPLNPEGPVLGAPPMVGNHMRLGIEVEAAVRDQARGCCLCQSRIHRVPVSFHTQLHMKNNFPLPPRYQ